MMKIFVIGSYFDTDTKKTEFNITRAKQAGIEILKKGHLPFVPQPMFASWETEVDKTAIMKACFDWIGECDAVLILNLGKEGGGTSRALEQAKNLHKVVFNSVAEIPQV